MLRTHCTQHGSEIIAALQQHPQPASLAALLCQTPTAGVGATATTTWQRHGNSALYRVPGSLVADRVVATSTKLQERLVEYMTRAKAGEVPGG